MKARSSGSIARVGTHGSPHPDYPALVGCWRVVVGAAATVLLSGLVFWLGGPEDLWIAVVSFAIPVTGIAIVTAAVLTTRIFSRHDRFWPRGQVRIDLMVARDVFEPVTRTLRRLLGWVRCG